MSEPELRRQSHTDYFRSENYATGNEESIAKDLKFLHATIQSSTNSEQVQTVSLSRLLTKAIVDLIFLAVGLSAVGIITDSEQGFSLCGNLNTTCIESTESCERLCGFKKFCALVSFFGLLPVFSESMETIAILRRAFREGDKVIIDSKTGAIFPATLAGTTLFKPLRKFEFLPARFLVACLEYFFLFIPVNNCQTVGRAILTIPDALFNLFLIPLSFALIGYGATVVEVLIGLIAIQLLAHMELDNLITKNLCNRYASIGESLRTTYIKTENEHPKNKTILTKCFEITGKGIPLNINSSELDSDNMVFVVNQLITFGFQGASLGLEEVDNSEAIFVLASFLRSSGSKRLKQLELRFGGDIWSKGLFNMLFDALELNTSLEKIALTNARIDDSTVDHIIEVFTRPDSLETTRLRLINFRYDASFRASHRISPNKLQELNQELNRSQSRLEVRLASINPSQRNLPNINVDVNPELGYD